MAKREKQKHYSLEFREMAVRRMKLGGNISELARELGVDRTCLYVWKRKTDRRPYSRVGAPERDWRDERIEELEAKITRLEGVIGGQWLELDFSKVPCAGSRNRGGGRKGGDGEKASMPRSASGCERKAD